VTSQARATPEVLLRLLARGLCCLLAASHLCAAQQPPPLSVQDALRIRSFGELMPIQFSADGRWLAYTLKDAQRTKPGDASKWARGGRLRFVTGEDIYISDVETGEARNLTGNDGDNWYPVWSPDGQFLAFLSDRNKTGAARVWIWDASKNKLRQVSDIDFTTTKMEWTPDSRRILLATLPATPQRKEEPQRGSALTDFGNPSPGKVAGSTVVVYRADSTSDRNHPTVGPWNLDDFRRDLVLLDVTSGEVTPIVHSERIATTLISPDGLHVGYTVPERFASPRSQQMLFDIVVTDLATKRGHIVASDVRLNYEGAAFSWSPDGEQLSFHAGGVDERTYDCYVVDRSLGEPRDVSNLPPLRMPSRERSAAPIWDVDGTHIYFTREGVLWRAFVGGAKAEEIAQIRHRQITQLIPQSGNRLWTRNNGRSTIVYTHDEAGKQDGLFELDLENGQSRPLLERGQCYTCINIDDPFAIVKAGDRIAFFAEDAKQSEDLWISDPSFESPRRLTHLNPQLDHYKMGVAQLVDWLSDDGERLQGALLLPSDYKEGKRYPLVVSVYGGESRSEYFDHFGLGSGGPINWQLLATRNYAVLLPDTPVRVSTPMLDLAKTVLPGVSRVVAMGIADPDRLAVVGQSYGGYSALALVVQTLRFKAAIEVAGLADLVGFYGEMDEGGSAYGIPIIEKNDRGGLGTTPWERRERYIENSPVFYFDRIETPILILHGSADRAVAPFLADQVFVGLRRLGKEVEYAKYQGEDHSPLYWSYPNQVDLCDRIIDWLESHLKK